MGAVVEVRKKGARGFCEGKNKGTLKILGPNQSAIHPRHGTRRLFGGKVRGIRERPVT